MTDLSYQELAHTQFNHALTLFRDAYGPYVLARLQGHFGEDLLTHITDFNAKAKSEGRMRFDFDKHHNLVLDVNAIIYLLMHDGSLRKHSAWYVPKLFAFENERHKIKDNTILIMPNQIFLQLIRETRNDLAHKLIVKIETLSTAVKNILELLKLLPTSFCPPQTVASVNLVVAQLSIYESAQSQQQTDATQKIEMSVLQNEIKRMSTDVSMVTAQEFPKLYDQITQIQQDQSSLLTGIFGALSDTKQETSAQITTLHADIQKLHEANNIRDMAMQQQRTVHESVMLHDAHIAELTQQLSGLNHQLTGMHQQLFDAHQQIAALQRTSADTARQLTDCLRDAHVVPPLPAPTSHHWRWVVVFLLLLVIGGVGALIWLGYVPRLN
jgi:hypothetical protein